MIIKHLKKLLVTLVTVSVMCCGAVTANADSVSVSLGGTGYTSTKDLSVSGRHTTYYCKLNSVKFDHLSSDTIPSGSYVYTRIRTAGGTAAGDLGSFSTVGYGYYYNYYSNYGYSGTYKIATNSNVRLAYSCGITWNP